MALDIADDLEGYLLRCFIAMSPAETSQMQCHGPDQEAALTVQE